MSRKRCQLIWTDEDGNKSICNKRIIYGIANIENPVPTHCKRHKTEDMKCITHIFCNTLFCDNRGNKKYDYYCTDCFPRARPGDKRILEIRIKTKELRVLAYLKTHYGDSFFIHDKTLFTENCDCSQRRKMDIYRMLYNGRYINIEVDENMHSGYDKQNEENRKNDIVAYNTTNYIWIRYNPDHYNAHPIEDQFGASMEPSKSIKCNNSFGERMVVLTDEIDKQIAWMESEDFHQDLLIREIYLFYNDFVLPINLDMTKFKGEVNKDTIFSETGSKGDSKVDTLFNCPVKNCTYTSSVKQKMSDHKKLKHKKCIYCDFMYAGPKANMDHCKTEHKDKADNRKKNPVNRFQCPRCPKTDSSSCNLTAHIKLHDKIKIECSYCDKYSFVKFSALNDHVETDHPEIDKANYYMCTTGCNRTYPNNPRRNKCDHSIARKSPTEKKHEPKPAKVKPVIKCLYCDKDDFLTYKELKDHTKESHNRTDYLQCSNEGCKSTHSSSGSLGKHKRNSCKFK
jgi:transcription elongation factor Elf1